MSIVFLIGDEPFLMHVGRCLFCKNIQYYDIQGVPKNVSTLFHLIVKYEAIYRLIPLFMQGNLELQQEIENSCGNIFIEII